VDRGDLEEVSGASAVKVAKRDSEVVGASLGITPNRHLRTTFPIICSTYSWGDQQIIV
jgi:hypothetical protein